MVEVDPKGWFERRVRNESLTRTEEVISPLLLFHDPPMAQAKGRSTDGQRNLRPETEKEQSTRREPSRFELVDRALEKNKPKPVQSLTTRSSKHLSASRSANPPSQNSRPQFRNPTHNF